MQKFVLFLIFIFFSSSALAVNLPLGPTTRSAGMGGVGVAIATDISSVYFNPAGILEGEASFDFTYGAAMAGPEGQTAKITIPSEDNRDPVKFIKANYDCYGNFLLSQRAFAGLSFYKMGISGYGFQNWEINKLVNTVAGKYSGSGGFVGILTSGRSYFLPFLPPLHIGGNIKIVDRYQMGAEITGNNGTYYNNKGYGFGLDVGVLTKIAIPGVGFPIKVGVVGRDLFENITYSRITGTCTFDAQGEFIGKTETKLSNLTETQSKTLAAGLGVDIPGWDTRLGLDLEGIEGDSAVAHLGIELPILFFTGRGGIVYGADMSYITLGLSFAFIDLAYVDGKRSNLKSYYALLAFAFGQ